MDQVENTLIDKIDFDVVMYDGDISVHGYEDLCVELNSHQNKANTCLLIIETPGGDPNAGFRIARSLHHNYDSFNVLIPRYCKSAGTLICTGANELFMDDMSELGPLDIQVKKDDEIFSRSSGLDIIQALNNLQSSALNTLKDVLIELTAKASLSTKVASEIACKLTSGIYEPIYAQIDPIKIAEMHRATSIAFSYGSRLNEKSNILHEDGLSRLVLHYPSHGFVIDRKEARSIFTRVSDAKSQKYALLRDLFNHLKDRKTVKLIPRDIINAYIEKELKSETGNTEADAKSTGDIQSTVIDAGQRNPEPIQEATGNIAAA